MSFEADLRSKINATPYGSDERNLYKVILEEIQTLGSGKALTDEQCLGVVKKTVTANEEVLGYLKPDDARHAKYVEENRLLQSLLPSYWSPKQIIDFLNEQKIDLSQCKSDGQKMGIVMKALKAASAPVEGDTVKDAIRILCAS